MVPAVGDPDLSASRSLADVIRLGDPDAIAGFRDAHVGKVRAFCAAVCLPELARQQRSCATCRKTATLMLEAEQTFVLASGPEVG